MSKKLAGKSPTLDHAAAVIMANGGYFDAVQIAAELKVTKLYASNILNRLKNRARYNVETQKEPLFGIKILSINEAIVGALTHGDVKRINTFHRLEEMWHLVMIGSRRSPV